jgi:hypothetical protein
MFVKEILCGKAYLMKKIDIKGRTRMGVIRVPKSHVRVILEEKPIQDFYKMILKGHSPPQFGEIIKTMLIQTGADYERVA